MPFDQILINNGWTSPAGNETIAVVSPSDGKEIARIARGGAEDIDHAVRAARRAFEGAWGRMPAVERGRLLTRLGLAILDHAEELALIEASDTGKPMKQARADIANTARYFEFYGGAADKFHGDTLPYLDGYTVMVLREARGVTGHIIPWNYPSQMFGRTLGPSLAAGNAAVLKPAEEACLACIRLAEIAMDVGFPPGTINLVTGYGEEAGAALAGHGDIDFLSFTGSPEVGTIVQKAAAEHHVPCVLELGGKSPQIVFEDADQRQATEVIANAIVQNAGQTCSAGSRVLVQRSIYDAFITELARRFSAIRVGPHHADLDCGPLISAVQRDRVAGFQEQARADGIPVLAEGTIVPDAPEGGFYVRPTLFGPVPQANALAREEVFGPVLSAIPFDDESDAVRIANGTDYGLVAGVWTSDGGRQLRLSRAVRAGQVFVNCYGAGGGIELPFGGVKKSGHGREKGFEALREFTLTKTVVLRHG